MVNNIKLYIKVFIIFFISLFFVISYKTSNEKILFNGNIDFYNKEEGYTFILDEYRVNKNVLELYGCALKLGQDLSYINNHFVLIDEENNFMVINTSTIKREDATKYFNDGFNYENSGIVGTVNLKYLDYKKIYKVGLLIIDKSGNRSIYISDKTYKKEM